MTPLEHIAHAVLAQALVDAGIVPREGKKNGARRNADHLEKDEAVAFLTRERGPWAESRRYWCAIADRDPEEVRRFAVARLAALPKPEAPEPDPVPLRRQPRPGTRQAIAIERLASPEGLDADAFANEFGWKRNTVLCLLTGDLPNFFGVRGVRGRDGRYRLAPAVPKSAKVVP